MSENININENKPTWFPWIGKNYFLTSHRIMLLGESHYRHGSYSCDDIEKDFGYTCNGLNDYVKLGKDAGNQYKTYDPMTDVLRGTLFPSSASRSDVWNNVAYMNIIQKCLEDKDGAKDWEDFLNGWKAVLQVVNILKPHIVVCFSSDKQKNRVNFNRQNEFKDELKFKYEVTPCEDTDEKVENTILATPGNISLPSDKMNIPVIFLRHASRIKDIDAWRQVLRRNIPRGI